MAGRSASGQIGRQSRRQWALLTSVAPLNIQTARRFACLMFDFALNVEAQFCNPAARRQSFRHCQLIRGRCQRRNRCPPAFSASRRGFCGMTTLSCQRGQRHRPRNGASALGKRVRALELGMRHQDPEPVSASAKGQDSLEVSLDIAATASSPCRKARQLLCRAPAVARTDSWTTRTGVAAGRIAGTVFANAGAALLERSLLFFAKLGRSLCVAAIGRLGSQAPIIHLNRRNPIDRKVANARLSDL